MELVHVELAVVVGAVLPVDAAGSVLRSVLKVSLVLDLAIVPGVLAKSILLILSPLAIEVVPISRCENSIALRSVSYPLAVVDVSVRLEDTSPAGHDVVLELSCVDAAI
jgi:hypothetical protein